MNDAAVQAYLREISGELVSKQATEHTYRPALKTLLASLDSSWKVHNEPKRSEHGAPDYIFVRGEVVLGYAETKDIDANLDKIEKSEQLKRYFGYTNLILTNYLEFRFFRHGERYGDPIVLGKIVGGEVVSHDLAARRLLDTLGDFLRGKPEPIKSTRRLAEIMGGRGRRIRDDLRQLFTMDAIKSTEVFKVYETVKHLLVRDLTPESFADMYSQTLIYGLFVARYHDETPENFTRQEARDLVPKSNPFLRHFFDHIVGPNFDKRLAYIVNEMCEVFATADVRSLMGQYFKGKNGDAEGPDPVIHFYEDFLREYDPDQRKKLGAFYTPQPVVRFIVRAVDDILKKEFGLPHGLADTSKIEVPAIVSGKKVKLPLHRVQVLDPATGTGTFLNEVVRLVHQRRAVELGQAGDWNSYVKSELLPRLHGFELMMASYVIAHLKLGMTLRETGYKDDDQRLGVYLTNALEEAGVHDGTLFAFGLSQSIAEEAVRASDIKRDKPVMVVIGNPPYSGESSNMQYKGHDVYKAEPTGGKLQERNSKWINDDYVKFIRLAESMVEKNGEGVVAMITGHGYIDNPTFRGMRHHLMQTFDDIYVLDLHGNSNKKEVTPSGNPDKNVFDIKTGVAILIGIKRKEAHVVEGARVFRADCYGNRQEKFTCLENGTFTELPWVQITPSLPNLEWIQKDEKALAQYRQGFSVAELFPVSSVGIVTARDSMAIQWDKLGIEKVIEDFQALDVEVLREKYQLGKDARDWSVAGAKSDVLDSLDTGKTHAINYRPFDRRWTFYTAKSKGFQCMPRTVVMRNFIDQKNYGLAWIRPMSSKYNFDIFVTDTISDQCFAGNKSMGAGISYVGPLYVFGNDGIRVTNLNKKIVEAIEKNIGQVSPEDIFDYIYASLRSPSYREKYQEFLKIDFPRIPYPINVDEFRRLAILGRELRELHLLKSPKVSHFMTTYPVDGTSEVEKVAYKDSSVFINAKQYFGGVPEMAWNFFVGGYQPAQKWLKDRKGRILTSEEIEHYQKMIVALVETERIMKEIG